MTAVQLIVNISYEATMLLRVLTLIVFGHIQLGLKSNALSIEDDEYVLIEPVKVDIEGNGGPFVEGGEISITCNASGYPTPTLQWYKGDDLLETNYRTKISANKLIISGADKNDTGAYRCDASNGYTCDIRTVDIVVVEPEPVQVDIPTTKGSFLEGSNISIPCIVSGYPTPTILWYKDNGLIQTNDRIKISEANILIISAADKTDTGKYRCEATNNYTSHARTLDIVVNAPVRANIALDESPFLKGSKISLDCNPRGFPIPTVLWYKDDILIRTDNRIRTLANTLIISTADVDDSGKYSCKASNKYTSDTHAVDIVVVEPVKVEIVVSKGPFHEGSQIRIACNVEGYPAPTLLWYKDDKLITRNNRIKIVANVLTISAAVKNDVGRYSCEAANKYRSVARTVDIVVIEPVKIKMVVNHGLIHQGSEISIACDVGGYPTPTLRWYKDDNLIRANNRINIAANKLTIPVADKSDHGKYRCEASNGYTSDARTVDITVIKPVNVKLAVDEGPFHHGSRIVIACNVEGYPTPTLQWYKDDNPIRTNYRIKISANKLIIADASTRDAGRYSCKAANQFTNGAHSVDIKVATPIKVTVVMDKGPFLKGSEVRLACNVDGYPTPNVKWYKDGILIQTNSRIKIDSAHNRLIISDAIESDTAKYRCEATNEYSSGAHTVDISVREKLVVKVIPRGVPKNIKVACQRIENWLQVCIPIGL